MRLAWLMSKLRTPSGLLTALMWGALLYMVAQRIPLWMRNYQAEGRPAGRFQALDASLVAQTLPKAQSKQILVFWATWCGPCGIELDRFNHAIRDGEISSQQVLAISVGEEPDVVFQAARERKYQFLVFANPSGLTTPSLPVEGTPQIYHIDANGRIDYASMGLSPLSIVRAKRFLSD